MRFALLGSGSKGNATLIEEGRTRILIDNGFTLRETEYRLGRLGLAPQDLTAVVVTHEHNDHIGGVGPLARRHGVPVWLTAGTWRVADRRCGELPQHHCFSGHEPFAIGELELTPFPVPHDAREPVQFVIGDGAWRLGVVTDCGRATPHMREQLGVLDALVLECNHDAAMLAAGPYPPALKARVGGGLGHLSNAQAAELLATLEHGRLQHVVAAHLSEQNNTSELAAQTLTAALGCETDWVAVAGQAEGLAWREIR